MFKGFMKQWTPFKTCFNPVLGGTRCGEEAQRCWVAGGGHTAGKGGSGWGPRGPVQKSAPLHPHPSLLN